jgi:hypothetical protein
LDNLEKSDYHYWEMDKPEMISVATGILENSDDPRYIIFHLRRLELIKKTNLTPKLIKKLTIDLEYTLKCIFKYNLRWLKIFAQFESSDKLCYLGEVDKVEKIEFRQEQILCARGNWDAIRSINLTKKHFTAISYCNDTDFVNKCLSRISENLTRHETESLLDNNMDAFCVLHSKLCSFPKIIHRLTDEYYFLKQMYDLTQYHDLLHEYMTDEWEDFEFESCCLPYLSVRTNLPIDYSYQIGRLISGREYYEELLDLQELPEVAKLMQCSPDLRDIRRELRHNPLLPLIIDFLSRKFGKKIFFQ